jgi:hypothetical protein
MGKIELDHTGSGSGVTLSSDGTNLLLDGSAIGGAGGGGDLLAANNLSDLDNAATARTNLGLGTAATTAASAYATAAQGATADAALPRTGGAMTGAITTNSTFDGRDVATDGAKLDGIEAGATADQTGAEIKTAYEAEANAFTDAQFTKLAGIEAGATADQSDAEIKTAYENNSNTNAFTDADHTKLDGIAAGANNYVHPNHTGEVTSTADGATVIADNVVDEANLKVSNAPTNGYFLSAQSGAAGGLTWAAVSGGGGAWNLISTTTVTSTVSTVDFTSIGSYNKYVLKWDCTMNATAIVKIQIYDNGTLVTSSDYVMLRGAFASYLAVQTTFSGILTSAGLNKQIGQLEISAVEPRLPFKMETAGISGTGDNGERTFTAGALKSTYSLTSFTGLRFGTTGSNNIDTGRFSLYGLSQ